MFMKKVLMGIALILSTGLYPLWAADTPSSANDSLEAKRAQQLLQRAVLRYQAVQDKALAEFARQGEFTDNELYVYVLDMDGVVLTSGGS
jgi:cytochrome c